MICCRIFVTFNILIGLHCMGVNVELVVIDGVLKDGSFECNNPVTFRCLVNPNTTIVQWFVGNPIGQFPDADCTGSPCGTSYEFPGRYEYTYNKSAGISYLKIAHTSFKDNQLIYQCSNGSSLHRGTYNATVIKAPPKNDTATLDIKTTTDQVKATVKMGCIYPVEDVVLKWYSTRAQETREHHGNYQLVPCSPVSNCERANTTKEGVLVINTTQTGEEREYFVNISFGSMYFLKPVGKYNVTLDSGTVSTNTPSSNPAYSPVTKPSSSETKTTITTTKLIESTTISSTTSNTNKPDNVKLTLIYIFVPVGGVIVAVIIIYVSCIICREKKSNKTI